MALTGPDDIRGVWATILCQLDQAKALDLAAIHEQVKLYSISGCNGVYSGGTASEIHTQTEAQFRKISTCFADAARAFKMSFQIGATHPLGHGTLDRVAFARTLNPGAIQITLPDWVPLDFDSVHLFMSRVTEVAGPTPIVLYNPPHAKTILTPSELNELACNNPTLVGLKCGGGDENWYCEMAPIFKRLSVFIPGHQYATGLKLGAHGSYSNMACLSPKAAVRWASEPQSTALDTESRVATFIRKGLEPLLARGLPGFACDKAMAAAGGWINISPDLMWPHVGATMAEVDHIKALAQQHIPEFLEPAHA